MENYTGEGEGWLSAYFQNYESNLTILSDNTITLCCRRLLSAVKQKRELQATGEPCLSKVLLRVETAIRLRRRLSETRTVSLVTYSLYTLLARFARIDEEKHQTCYSREHDDCQQWWFQIFEASIVAKMTAHINGTLASQQERSAAVAPGSCKPSFELS